MRALSACQIPCSLWACLPYSLWQAIRIVWPAIPHLALAGKPCPLWHWTWQASLAMSACEPCRLARFPVPCGHAFPILCGRRFELCGLRFLIWHSQGSLAHSGIGSGKQAWPTLAVAGKPCRRPSLVGDPDSRGPDSGRQALPSLAVWQASLAKTTGIL